MCTKLSEKMVIAGFFMILLSNHALSMMNVVVKAVLNVQNNVKAKEKLHKAFGFNLYRPNLFKRLLKA